MKAALQLRQSQQLTLTPQLQQSIRLLQLSSLDINQETARLLDENPFLEREDEDFVGYASDAAPAAPAAETGDQEAGAAPVSEEWGEIALTRSHPDDDEDSHPETAAGLPSLREHLLLQLGLSQIDFHDRQLVALLIEALDGAGFLAQSLEDILAMLPEELDVTLDDLQTALVQLQHLDEPGIAARDLSECLSLQLLALPATTPGRTLALRLTDSHLDLLAAHDYNKLKKQLRCDDDALRVAQALVLSLNPRPAARFEERTSEYVVPDVIVERQRGRWLARLNPEAMPRLKINQLYASLLQRRDEQNSLQMSEQLQEARWFIKNLQQRFDTILRVAQAIVERQRLFFEHGAIAMRPLVLREIADQLELHESTISRVTTQKFMLTPHGILEFKYFFGSGVATDSGGGCSSTAIRALIRQLVAEEDARHPLSDSRLAEILVSQGIQVARRTVAKYRESLNILPVNLRKSL
jgi:RNA polymerase sigma-54 factor